MTREELKFAMQIEKAINSIPIPHYRQLIVEATLMACLILQTNSKFFFNGVIDMDGVVQRASNLYRTDAEASGVSKSALCLLQCESYPRANTIIANFIDCAPSGKYGTMNYMLRALFDLFNLNDDGEWQIDPAHS